MNADQQILKVLICDDDPQDRKLIRTFLSQQTGTEIVTLEAGQAADIEAALAKGRIDLVFMDVQMPGRSGIEWLKDIVERQLAPVVMLTGFGSEETAVEALEYGAIGYLPKSGLTPEKLMSTVAAATKKWRDGQLSIASQEELERIASIDPMTGIANRRAIMNKLNDAMARAKRYQEPLAVIMLDLDFFKAVNDTFGHIIGDDVLEKVGAILRTRIRDADAAGRYGGEEFLIVLPNTDALSAYAFAERTRQIIANADMTDNNGNVFHITISQGLSCHVPGDDTSALVSRADSALYKAKQSGRNRVMVDESQEKVTVETSRDDVDAHQRGSPSPVWYGVSAARPASAEMVGTGSRHPQSQRRTPLGDDETAKAMRISARQKRKSLRLNRNLLLLAYSILAGMILIALRSGSEFFAGIVASAGLAVIWLVTTLQGRKLEADLLREEMDVQAARQTDQISAQQDGPAQVAPQGPERSELSHPVRPTVGSDR